MRTSGVRFMLMGGQACVLYGAAEFSRDLDLLILADQANTGRLMNALGALQAVPIAIPDFDPEVLRRGHAVHFRCGAPGVEDLRIDLMSTLRSADGFDDLWERRTVIEGSEGRIDMLGVKDLVQAKKTQRDKDWPMIRRLVESDYFRRSDSPQPSEIGFWLSEARTAELLIELAECYPAEAALAAARPAVRCALSNDLPATRRALFEEEQAEREADRVYWEPLKRELEQMRREKLRARG